MHPNGNKIFPDPQKFDIVAFNREKQVRGSNRIRPFGNGLQDPDALAGHDNLAAPGICTRII